jgi:integrase
VTNLTGCGSNLHGGCHAGDQADAVRYLIDPDAHRHALGKPYPREDRVNVGKPLIVWLCVRDIDAPRHAGDLAPNDLAVAHQPATKIAHDSNRHFEAVGLDRKHWRDACAIRRIFKRAFERSGLPNYNPHSFRHTLALLGEKICRTPEEWKAYSQNFGHSSPMTTFNSYGPVAPHRQAEILDA